jgi:hypothetical protein
MVSLEITPFLAGFTDLMPHITPRHARGTIPYNIGMMEFILPGVA